MTQLFALYISHIVVNYIELRHNTYAMNILSAFFYLLYLTAFNSYIITIYNIFLSRYLITTTKRNPRS